MRIGSIFSGIGGLELGLERAGVGHTAWQCDSDPYARAVLERHWPTAIRYDDVRGVARGARARHEQRCDLLVGGPPCQDVSCAGRGAGMGVGTRSGLWWEFERVVRALRPPFVFLENPARSRGRWLPTITSSLAAVGYRWSYVCVRACDLGYHHERDRVFVLAADAHRDRLRGLCRRGRRTHWACTSIAADDGAPGRRPPLPPMVRAVYGLPHRVDRMRCLGNACIPEQAAEAWSRLVRFHPNF